MNHKPLGELFLTDYAAARPILEAWARGETLEWLHSGTGNWHKAGRSIELNAIYRIPHRPHTVDWSQVRERVVVFHTDINGDHWAADDDSYGWPADLWSSFRPGTMHWKKSRIERPKEVK